MMLLGCRRASSDAAAVPTVEPSTLASDEVVAFFPTFAVVRDGAWQLPIDAWVYEPEDDAIVRRAAIELVAKAMGRAADGPESEVIAANLRPFFVDNERGEWVALRAGSHVVRLGPTTPDGRAAGTLSIELDDPVTRGQGSPPWVQLSVVLREGDEREFGAWSQLLADEGTSVISDIDDTIKVTGVTDRKTMLENTFLRPFEAVPMMAAAYQRWADKGMAFHYLSASPRPLQGALSRMLADEKFPRGTLSLRPFRWIDGSALDLLSSSQDYKLGKIADIIESFDERRFVLVGDTGEHDPEIYAAVARRFSDRVSAVYLRDPTPGGTPGLAERLDTAFEGLPPTLWHVILDGNTMPASP